MLGSTKINKEVRKLYKGKSYIETTIVLRTELDKDSQLYKNLSGFMGNIEPTMNGINKDIEDIIIDNFEDNSDILQISSHVKL